MTKPLRISLVKENFDNCTFHMPPCVTENNLETIGVTRLIAKLLAPQGYNTSDIQYIPCDAFTSEDDDAIYPNTVLGAVEHGLADLSDFLMTLNQERSQNLSYAGQLDTLDNILIFKRPNIASRVQIGPQNFLPDWRISILIAIAASILLILPRKWKQTVPVIERVKPLVGLVIQVILGFFSTTVVLLLNVPVHEKPLISSFENLIDLAMQGRVKLVTPYSVINHLYSDPTWLKSSTPALYQDLMDHLKENPITETDTLEESMNKTFLDSEHTTHVIIGVTSDLPWILASYCNMVYVVDKYSPYHPITVYIRNGLNVHQLTFAERQVIKMEKKRLQNIQFKPLMCNLHSHLKMNDAKPTTIGQLQSAFWMLLIMYSAAFVLAVFRLTVSVVSADITREFRVVRLRGDEMKFSDDRQMLIESFKKQKVWNVEDFMELLAGYRVTKI